MNKTLYNFTQRLLNKYKLGGRIKNSALATRLYVDYNFGQLDLDKEWLSFSLTNILALSDEIKNSELHVDIRNYAYPSKKDRLTTAGNNRNEKNNSYAVSKDFILLNSLSELNLNQSSDKISPLTSLGSYVKADDINSVEHSAIILVENLAVMSKRSKQPIPVINFFVALKIRFHSFVLVI